MNHTVFCTVYHAHAKHDVEVQMIWLKWDAQKRKTRRAVPVGQLAPAAAAAEPASFCHKCT